MQSSCSAEKKAPARDTEELLDILERSRNLTGALKAMEGDMTVPAFTQCLAGYMKERGLNATGLSEAALLSRSFTYQLCSGERRPSRDIILRS